MSVIKTPLQLPMRKPLSLAIESAVAAFNAVSFNGTDQYGTLPVYLSPSGVFEFRATLFMVDRLADYVLLDSASGLIRLEVSTAGYLRWRFNNSGTITYATSTAKVPLGQSVAVYAQYRRNTSTATMGVNTAYNFVSSINFPAAFAGFTYFGSNYASATGRLKATVDDVSFTDPYCIQPLATASSVQALKGDGVGFTAFPTIQLLAGDTIELDLADFVIDGTESKIIATSIADIAFRKRSTDQLAFNSAAFSTCEVNGVGVATSSLSVVAGRHYHVVLTSAATQTIVSILSAGAYVHCAKCGIANIRHYRAGVLRNEWLLNDGFLTSANTAPGGGADGSITWINGSSANVVNYPKVNRTHDCNEQSGNQLLDSAGGSKHISLINYLPAQRVTI